MQVKQIHISGSLKLAKEEDRSKQKNEDRLLSEKELKKITNSMLVKPKDPLEQLCSSFEFAFHYQISDCKLNIPTKENVVFTTFSVFLGTTFSILHFFHVNH